MVELPQSSVFHQRRHVVETSGSPLLPPHLSYHLVSYIRSPVFRVTNITYQINNISVVGLTMVSKSVLEESIRKGPWLEEEDERLETFVTLMGERRWDSIARVSGLRRSGKSCRLRWMNYLRPDLKHGQLSAEEENTVLQLQERWGNKWSKIARKLPGRTDNEIKNYWRTYVRKKTQAAEQDNSQRETNIVKSEPHNYSIEMEDISKTTSFEQHGYVKEDTLMRTSEHSSMDAFGSFDGACSPYEIQLSDWMSESSIHREEEPKYDVQCSSILDSWSPYPTWVSGDTTDSIWDCSSVSLWEMED